MEIAEYAKANRLLQEPAFRWWAPYALNCTTPHAPPREDTLLETKNIGQWVPSSMWMKPSTMWRSELQRTRRASSKKRIRGFWLLFWDHPTI